MWLGAQGAPRDLSVATVRHQLCRVGGSAGLRERCAHSAPAHRGFGTLSSSRTNGGVGRIPMSLRSVPKLAPSRRSGLLWARVKRNLVGAGQKERCRPCFGRGACLAALGLTSGRPWVRSAPFLGGGGSCKSHLSTRQGPSVGALGSPAAVRVPSATARLSAPAQTQSAMRQIAQTKPCCHIRV